MRISQSDFRHRDFSPRSHQALHVCYTVCINPTKHHAAVMNLPWFFGPLRSLASSSLRMTQNQMHYLHDMVLDLDLVLRFCVFLASWISINPGA